MPFFRRHPKEGKNEFSHVCLKNSSGKIFFLHLFIYSKFVYNLLNILCFLKRYNKIFMNFICRRIVVFWYCLITSHYFGAKYKSSTRIDMSNVHTTYPIYGNRCNANQFATVILNFSLFVTITCTLLSSTHVHGHNFTCCTTCSTCSDRVRLV